MKSKGTDKSPNSDVIERSVKLKRSRGDITTVTFGIGWGRTWFVILFVKTGARLAVRGIYLTRTESSTLFWPSFSVKSSILWRNRPGAPLSVLPSSMPPPHPDPAASVPGILKLRGSRAAHPGPGRSPKLGLIVWVGLKIARRPSPFSRVPSGPLRLWPAPGSPAGQRDRQRPRHAAVHRTGRAERAKVGR
jgi:hypothetical protein